MDTRRFDSLARALATSGTRRGLLTLLAALPLLAGPERPGVAVAKKNKKKGKKKVSLCLDGQTLTIPKSKKKLRQLRQRGAIPGACQESPPPPPPPPLSPPPPGCAPRCPGAFCGGNDGCGGICACPAGSICHLGVCKPCDIACPPGRAGCGADLQDLLASGGTVIACPGRYVGTYILGTDVTLIGAGDSDDPATNTILDANGTGRVVETAPAKTVSLQRIRIQGGIADSGGGGVLNQGTLALKECTVTGNETTSGSGGGVRSVGNLELTECIITGNEAPGGFGGGISTSGSLTLTLTRCRVTSNKAVAGGGVFMARDSVTTLVRSVVSQNETSMLDGGGIRLGASTLRVTDSSQITGNQAGTSSSAAGGGIAMIGQGIVEFDASSSVTNNTSTDIPSGIYHSSGTVTLNGATVCGNTPEPQCIGVEGCPNVATCDG